MGKGKKQTPSGLVFLKGVSMSLGIYLLGQLLVTLLVVKGVLEENGMFPAVAVLCLLASFVGGFFCARRPMWGALPNALLCSVLFAAVLAAVGILCWEEGISWLGQGGILLLCAFAGGLLAGLAGGGHRKKRRRKMAAL